MTAAVIWERGTWSAQRTHNFPKWKAIPREIPSTSLGAGSSLRLKDGYARNDADRAKE